MKSLAKAYKKLKRESENFGLTKNEFLIYVMCLFPMFKTELLKLPIKRKLVIASADPKDIPPDLSVVEIRFTDLWDYLNKRVFVLQDKF